MGLLLYAGQRLSDVVGFGPHKIKNGWLVFTRYKNRNRKPIRMEIPARPELLDLIDQTATGQETFLTTASGTNRIVQPRFGVGQSPEKCNDFNG